jgi:hypothetical protein
MSNYDEIRARLEREREGIDRAIAAVRRLEEEEAAGSGATVRPFALASNEAAAKGRKPMSAEARARMAEGQRRRYAARKAAAKRAGKKRALAKAAAAE